MGSTLNVAGETTLGANTSVTGDVSVTGNVSASDATAATHLASFGQLTTAADSLQDNIEDVQADVDQNEIDSDNADDLLNARADSLVTALESEINTTNGEITALDGRADSLVTALAGEVTRATDREDSIVTALNGMTSATETVDGLSLIHISEPTRPY